MKRAGQGKKQYPRQHFVLKMLEMGIKEEEDGSDTQDFVNLQYKILEYMSTYEGYIHPTFRVILVTLWGMRPEIINEENPVKPVEECAFMGDDLDIIEAILMMTWLKATLMMTWLRAILMITYLKANLKITVNWMIQ